MKAIVIIRSLVYFVCFMAATVQLFAQEQQGVFNEIDELSKKIGVYCPEVGEAFLSVHDSIILSEGSLSIKHKELMALSIAIYAGCEKCVYFHTMGAKKNGASEKEIFESAAVAFYMAGGPALTYINYVFKALEELAMMDEQQEDTNN